MKKYKFVAFFALILIIVAFYIYSVKAYADAQIMRPYVNFYIEGYDKTIAYGKVEAYTFIDALREITQEKNIDIMFEQNGDKSQIYAIDNITNNKFSSSDGWYGYIIRNNAIIEQDDYLNLYLQDNDDVILYYGDLNKTEKIINIYSDVDRYMSGDDILFKIESQYTQWREKNGEWKPSDEGKNIKDVKIHISTPKNDIQAITDVNGQATIEFDGVGVYSYYADGYRDNDVPIIVKTKNYYSVYGLHNESKLTRAEVTSFLVNQCKLENKSSDKKYEFNDISNNVYYDEINIAVSNEIISGYNDNTFRPDNDVTFLELGIMLYNIYGKEAPKHDIEINGIPQWAQRSIVFVMESGFFDGINVDWNHNVSSDDILKLYFNLKEKGMI